MAVSLSACVSPKAMGNVKEQVELFHQRVNQGKFAEIYETASPQWRTAMSRQQQDATLQRMREQMGVCSPSGPNGFQSKATGSGTRLVLSYTAKCERGNLDEAFAWMVVDDQARLAQFRPGASSFEGEE